MGYVLQFYTLFYQVELGEGEVEGGEVGAGDDVGDGGPCRVWVALGVRRSRADLLPSRDLMELSGFLPSLDLTGEGMRGLSIL